MYQFQNGYQNGYQMYPQYQTDQRYAYNQNSQDDRIWVQNQTAAEAYLVAPNGSVRLWDSQKPVFYEKYADQTGKIYMTVYDYTRRGAQMPAENTVGQRNMIDERLAAIENRITILEKRGESHDEQ